MIGETRSANNSVTVQVRNQNGQIPPEAAQRVKVNRWMQLGDTWTFLETSSANHDAEVTYSSAVVQTGATYRYSAYYEGVNAFDNFGELWTQRIHTATGGIHTLTLTRNMPYASSFRFYSNGGLLEPGSLVAVGSTVSWEADVVNNSLMQHSVNVDVRADRSRATPWDYNHSSAHANIAPGGTRRYEGSFTVSSAGDFHAAIRVNTAGGYGKTDSWDWEQRFRSFHPPGSFDLVSPADGLTVGLDNAPTSFTWQSSPYSTEYDVYLDRDPFGGIPTTKVGTVTGLSWPVNLSMQPSNWKWRVVAKNEGASTNSTSTRGFTILDSSTVTVQVRNQNGQIPPEAAQRVKVDRWIQAGAGWTFLETSNANQSAQVTYSSAVVQTGATYRYDSYYEGANPFDSLGELWTQRIHTATGGIHTLTLTRNMPYASSFRFYSNGGLLEPGSLVAVGSTVSWEADVVNNSLMQHSVSVDVRADRSRTSPWDYDHSSAYANIAAGGTRLYGGSFTVSSAGDFHAAIRVNAAGGLGKTDSWDWAQRFRAFHPPGSFDLVSPADGLSFTIENQPTALTWQSSPYSTEYDVYLDKDPFGGIPMAKVGTVTGLSWPVNLSMQPGNWKWRVVAKNEGASTNSTSTRGFTILPSEPDSIALSGSVKSARFPNRTLRGINIQTSGSLPKIATTSWDGTFMLEELILPFEGEIIASHPDWWANDENTEHASVSVSIPLDHTPDDIPNILFDGFRNKGQARVSFSTDKQVVRPGETVIVTITLENIGLPLIASDSYLDLSFENDIFNIGELTGNGWDMIEHYPPDSIIYNADGNTMTAVNHLVSAARLNASFSSDDQFQLQIPLMVKPGLGDKVLDLRVRGTIGDHITPDVAEGRPKDQQGYFYWSLPIVIIDDISDLPGWEFTPEFSKTVGVYLEGRNGQDYPLPVFFPLLNPFDGDDAAKAAFSKRLFGVGRDNLRDFDFRKNVYRGIIREIVTQASDAKQKTAIARAILQSAEFAASEEAKITELLSVIASYDIENETAFSQIPQDATYALKLAEALAIAAAKNSIPVEDLPAVNSLGQFFDLGGLAFNLLNISVTAAFHEAIATDLALKRLVYLAQQNPFEAYLNGRDEAWEDAISEVRGELMRIIDGDRWAAYLLAWEEHWDEVVLGGLKVVYGVLVKGLHIGWATVPIAWDYFFNQSIAYEDAFFHATAALKISNGLRDHGAVHPFRNEIILAAESIVYREGISVIDNQTYFNGKIFSSSSNISFPTLRNHYRNRKALVDQAYADASVPLGHAVVGTVTDQDGTALSGIPVSLTSGGGQTTTREDGRFFLLVLPGWSGEVIPSFHVGEFNPSSRSYEPVHSNILHADFVLNLPVEVPTWTISVAASPQSGGFVSGGGNFTDGSQVPIQATVAQGYRFDGWSGAAGIGNPSSLSTTVMATANKSLVANFVKVWNLQVTSEDPSRGTVSGGGIFDAGQLVTITASPQSGFRFGGWSGGIVANSDSSQTSVVLNADMSLTAKFLINASDGYNRFAESFGSESDIARIGPMGDFTGNGLPNILEYGFAIDPESEENRRPIRSVEIIEDHSGKSMGIEVMLRTDDPEISYFVEVGTGLNQWERVALTYSGGQWVTDRPGVVSVHSVHNAGENVTRVVIKDGTEMSASSERFIRMAISHPY